MKKTFGTMLLAGMFTLSGCFHMSPNGPASVSFENRTYKTGFYGTLFPNGFDFDDDMFTVNHIEFQKIEHDTFHLFHADIGPYTSGTIYCDEENYEEACLYYSDPKNFLYQCIIGIKSTETTQQFVELQDVDPQQFQALLDFAESSEYLPFDAKHNRKIKKVELPMPDNKQTKRLVFYKESKDSLFISSKGHEYYIIDNALYFVYQYDYGHGEYEKLIAVSVPSAISDYFVKYMEPYLS